MASAELPDLAQFADWDSHISGKVDPDQGTERNYQ